MTRMFVRHSVSDYDKWKRAYDGFEDQRREMGVVAHGVFKSVEDPHDVTVWHDFETLASAREFAGSDRLREAMTAGGVAGKPEVWFTTQV
jgi:hypothetical protein